MRISIDHTDPGFRAGLLATPPERLDVYLDGDLLGAVVTADEEAGLVLVYAQDESGDWCNENGALKRFERRGKVEIRAR